MSEHDYLLADGGNAVRPLHAIAIEVCQKHRVNMNELVSLRRHKSIVAARFEFCWRARNESSASFPEIGRFIKRDHTSVMNAVERYPAVSARAAALSTEKEVIHTGADAAEKSASFNEQPMKEAANEQV